MVYEPLHHALHIWSVYASIQNWKSQLRFFSRRIEWRPKKIVFIRRILGNAISSGKKKSHKSLFESVSRNTWKYMKLKYVNQVRKKASIVSSWSRSHSPIDNCSLFIRHKNINHKQLATNTGYAAIHDGNPGVGIGHDRATEGIVSSIVLTFVTEPKIQIHSNVDGCT